jgi:hypothetical protein
MDTGENVVRETLNAEGVDTGEQSPALPEGLTPQTQSTTQNQPGAKLIFGKFKDMAAAEKAYKESQQKITATSERQKKLDAILNKPEFKKHAATDPAMKQALTELGYSLAEIEQAEDAKKQDADGNVEWDGNTNSADYRMMLFERKYELREQKAGIEAEIKRPLKPEEWQQVKDMIRTTGNPQFDARLAWKLTPAYETLLKEREKKAVDAARGPQNRGTRPPPQLLPTGEKSDLTKRPSKMTANEKRDFIGGIVRGEIK